MTTRLIAQLVAVLFTSAYVAAEPPKPKFKLGKDTTFVDGPLDKDGYIDYETALNDRLRGKIKPEDNAVLLLVQAIGPKPEGIELHADLYKWLGTKPPPETGDYLVRDSTFFRDEYRADDTRPFFDLESRLRRAPWKATDHPKHAEWLKVNEKPMSLAIEASKRTEYFHPLISRTKTGERGMLIGPIMPIAVQTRQFGSLLVMRAMLHLGEGRAEAAWDDLLALHRLGLHLSRSGSLMGTLIGIALESIAMHATVVFIETTKPTAEQVAKCQTDLRRLRPMASLADIVGISERFSYLDATQHMARKAQDKTDETILLLVGEDAPQEVIDKVTLGLDWVGVMRTGNKWYDRLEQALRTDAAKERVELFRVMDEELKKMTDKVRDMTEVKKLIAANDTDKLTAVISEKIGHGQIGLMVPAGQKIREAVDRCEQQHRNLHLAFALAAYHADHKKYPAALADLASKYIEQVPTDLFSGKPLVYKPSDAGYLLYSVGVNGTDDGGKTFGDDPPGDDLRVRMPSVKSK